MAKNIFITIICSIIINIKAQVPINDNCSSAISLLPSLSCQTTVGTVSLATQSLPPITCGVGTSALSNDVWYKFIATAPVATITAAPNTQGGNNFNIVIALYSACNGSLIACADNLGNLQAESIFANGLVTGDTYFFNVYQYKNNINSTNPANPTFSVCVISQTTTPPAPINDDCSGAIELFSSSTCNYTIGTTEYATQSLANYSCGNSTSASANDVWYKFTATTSNATITAVPNLQLGNDFNIVIGLYSACDGSLITCADNLGNLQAESIFANGLIIGNTYYFNVYQYKNNINNLNPANPTFSVCIVEEEPTNIKTLNGNKKFTISPNPVKSYITISKELIDNTYYILIYDMNGKTILHTDKIENTLNLETLAPGEYNIMFIQKKDSYNSKDMIITKKIIKQ